MQTIPVTNRQTFPVTGYGIPVAKIRSLQTDMNRLLDNISRFCQDKPIASTIASSTPSKDPVLVIPDDISPIYEPISS